MFSPYGECWRQLRKICNLELLSGKQVQSLRSVREEEVSKFVKSISQNPGSLVNLSTSLSSLIYGITAKAAFGKKCKEQDAFISLVNDSTLDYRGLDFKYTPFGAGRRICPGISFGLANIELPLASLLYHFDWKLVDGIDSNDLDMSEVFGVTVGRKNDLVAIPTPYVNRN